MHNSSPSINLIQLKKHIAAGRLDQVLQALIDFIEGADTKMTTEIYLTSVRYRKLELEKRRGKIATKDYKTEFNSVTFTLLEIIDSLSKLDTSTFKSMPSRAETQAEIVHLSRENAQ